jgi:hypothetical protein
MFFKFTWNWLHIFHTLCNIREFLFSCLANSDYFFSNMFVKRQDDYPSVLRAYLSTPGGGTLGAQPAGG